MIVVRWCCCTCVVHAITRLAVILEASGICGWALAYWSSSCMRSAWLLVHPNSESISLSAGIADVELGAANTWNRLFGSVQKNSWHLGRSALPMIRRQVTQGHGSHLFHRCGNRRMYSRTAYVEFLRTDGPPYRQPIMSIRRACEAWG